MGEALQHQGCLHALGCTCPAEGVHVGCTVSDPRRMLQCWFAAVQVLLLHDNHLRDLPDSICGLTSLTELDLHCNQLMHLPRDFTRLTRSVKRPALACRCHSACNNAHCTRHVCMPQHPRPVG